MLLALSLAVVGALLSGPSQSATPAPASLRPRVPETTNEPLRVFLDCQVRCDLDFVRTEVAFVSFVRDRKDADVHVLITGQRTGSGGNVNTLAFIGLDRFDGIAQTVTQLSEATATDDEIRRGLLRAIKLGLVPYVTYTPQASQLDIQFRPPSDRATAAGANGPDPWNLWYFRIRLNGNLSGEESSSRYSGRGFVSANRTTDRWKINSSLNGDYNKSRYTLSDDSTYTATQRSLNWTTLVVRSLNEHWSAALRSTVSGSTFTNLDAYVRLAPGIEYNVFPYSESTRRKLTLQWTAGLDRYDYIEETIFGKRADTQLDQTLIASLDLTQPWGSTDFAFEASHFLDDPAKYRLNLFGSADVRLFKGFSFNVFGNVDRIRDQIYLPRGGATDQEILVRQRQLQTSYSYFLSFGIGYSFGSKYQNVVNPRFGGSSGGRVVMF